MEVLIITVFVSVVLVAAALWFFAWNVHQRSHDHADRLALLPLSDDDDAAPAHPAAVEEGNP